MSDCKRTTSSRNVNNIEVYSECMRPVKFTVKYCDSFGNVYNEDLCGIHAKSVENHSKRMKEKHNFDTGLVITKLTEK